jgi:mannosylglycerate hydrolase
MPRLSEDLADRARAVLERNRRGSWTCPSSRLYPHQWLWDSCFIAIGLARYDPDRAASELRALFRGQWRNGMLPHIVFGDGRLDLGSRRIWKSKKNPQAPRDVDTSCITQPPLAAIAVARVAETLPAPDRQQFLAELFPKLVAYHTWLYEERDPHNRGLVTLIHPWECGLDTTPPWMQALRGMPVPWWLRLASRLRLVHAVHYLRTDTRYLPAAQRASDDDGLRMLVLATRAQRHQFQLERMPPRTSVLIEDLPFNAMLAAANRSLERVARELDTPLPPALRARFELTDAALDELWDEASGQYYSRDAVTGALLTASTVATFLPLWSASPARSKAERLIAQLQDPAGFWPRHPVPSVPLDDPEFEAARYWKGPTWINVNWILVECLREYDHLELARELRQQTLALVDQGGFSEYFSPLTGEGYGAEDFSWTAALAIDLLAPDPPRPATPQ